MTWGKIIPGRGKSKCPKVPGYPGKNGSSSEGTQAAWDGLKPPILRMSPVPLSLLSVPLPQAGQFFSREHRWVLV